MNIRGMLVALAGLALLSAAPARAADVTGKASFERMGQKGEVDLTDGKVKTDDISFVEMLDFQGNKVAITYTGKIAGDEIKFTRKVGEFATEDLVAKRVKD